MGLSLLFSEAIDSKTAADIHLQNLSFFLYGLKGSRNLIRSFKSCQDILFAA